MIITYWKGLYIVDKPDTLDRAAKLTKAGWKEHIPGFGCDARCKACIVKVGRRYYTDTFEIASPFASFFNTAAKEQSRKKMTAIEKSRSVKSTAAIPAPPGLDYLGYQKAGIEYACQKKDTLIGDEMGLGKTIQAIGFVNKISPENVVVVCPASLKYNWLEEAQKWLVEDRWKIHVSEDASAPPDETNFLIVNYEKLIRPNELLMWMRRIWGVMICDEAHVLKNPRSKRTNAILGADGAGLALMRRSHRSLFLTGTPVLNAPKELWPIISAISPAQFGDWDKFAERYCGPKVNPVTGWVEYKGGTNLEELQTRLRATCMVRRLKKDVLKELPPKLRQIVYLDDGKQIKDPAIERWNRLFGSDMAKAEAMMEAAKTEEDFKAAIKKMDAIVGIAFEEMSKFRHQTAIQKLPMAIEYIENYLNQTESKVIVFAHHKDVLKAILSHFGEKAIGIWGDGASDKERQEKVHVFQENPEIRLFVGGLKAAGVGITLTAASTVIFVEGDWTPATMMQAEDRAHRIGQTNPVHIIQLVLRDSLDANMAKYVLRKMRLIERTLDQKLKVESAVA